MKGCSTTARTKRIANADTDRCQCHYVAIDAIAITVALATATTIAATTAVSIAYDIAIRTAVAVAIGRASTMMLPVALLLPLPCRLPLLLPLPLPRSTPRRFEPCRPDAGERGWFGGGDADRSRLPSETPPFPTLTLTRPKLLPCSSSPPGPCRLTLHDVGATARNTSKQQQRGTANGSKQREH